MFSVINGVLWSINIFIAIMYVLHSSRSPIFYVYNRIAPLAYGFN
jgi:hypothetical protein